MEKEEPYQPSKDEIKKAEEAMDRKQSIMTDLRENDLTNDQKFLIQKMETGDFDLHLTTEDIIDKETLPIRTEYSNFKGVYIGGKIGEHKVRLSYSWSYVEPPRMEFMGSIDGELINKSLACDLFIKYYEVAKLQSPEIYEKIAEATMAAEEYNERVRKFWEDQGKPLEKQEEEKQERVKDEKEKYKDLI